MKNCVESVVLFLALLFSGLRALAGASDAPAPTSQIGGEYKSTLLYTSPAPGVSGGLHLVAPVPVEFALAVPESNQEHVYKADPGPGGREISFTQLPVSKYDLVLATAEGFYEGLVLNRDEDSLAAEDIQSIEEIFSRTVPFFDVKRTERIHGTPGDDGRATALVQWMRVGGRLLNQNGDLMAGHQIRSLRLAFLADVGPGWQVTATRELIRTDVFPAMRKGFLPVAHVAALSGARVTDGVKELGEIALPAVAPPQ